MPRISEPLPGTGDAGADLSAFAGVINVVEQLPSSAGGGAADGEAAEPAGYVLKFVESAIFSKDESLSAMTMGEMSEAQQAEVRKANRAHRATWRQVQLVLKRLRTAGFEVETIKEPGGGEGTRAAFLLRLWMDEERLCEVAEEMEFDKELRAVHLPVANWGGGKLTEEIPGGFMHFSRSRACCHPPADEEQNIRVPLANTKAGQAGLCPNPDLGGGGGGGKGQHYGGIYKLSPDGSIFEQCEALAVQWWAIEHLTGLRVQFAAGGSSVRCGQLSIAPDEEFSAPLANSSPSAAAAAASAKRGAAAQRGGRAAQRERALPPPPEGLLFFDNFSPLHSAPQLAALKRGWALKFCTMRQPICAIKAYFGQKVALYFDFVGVLERWLMWPSLVCAGLFAWQLAERVYTGEKTATGIGGQLDQTYRESMAGPVYCVAILIFATIFEENWKRRSYRNQLRWGTLDHQEAVIFRRPWLDNYFKRHPCDTDAASAVEPMKAVTLDKEWLQTRWEPCCAKSCRRLAFFKFGQRWKILVSTTVVSMSVLVVLFSLSVVLLLRIRYTSKGDLLGAYATAMVNGCLIQFYSVVYSFVAHKLTEWENHRTEYARSRSRLVLPRLLY